MADTNEVVQDEIPPDDSAESPQEEEKYSAQVLRRMHADALVLLEQYDEMRGPLEHEGVAAHLQKKLESLVEEIEDIEAAFDKHHGDLPPLENGGAEDEGEVESEEVEEEPVQDEADSGSEEYDPDAEQEEPTPEEALEGMEHKVPKETKALPKQRVKSMCRCGKCAACNKGKSITVKKKSAENREDVPGDEEHHNRPRSKPDTTGTLPGNPGEEERQAKPGHQGGEEDVPLDLGEEEHQNKPGDQGTEESFLQPHEKKQVFEASEHLKNLVTEQAFGDEHRMDSYHHHKALKSIVDGANERGVMTKDLGLYEENREEVGVSGIGNKPSMGAAQTKCMEGYKALRGSSTFLHALSGTRDYNDGHRAKALEWHKALDPMVKDVNEEGEGNAVEPGQMDTKKLHIDLLKSDLMIDEMMNTFKKLEKLAV